ncbi:hypothetical protein [Kitasatospora sp. NPDC096204]|uniref:hypothetical protein n=1 Tax=Kitasatospora sp. NPDC096204 TaxID=3364094 RepID=UPI00381B8575
MAERPRRRRALPIAVGAAVLVAGVGGGLWYARPWQGVDLPQSACWNAFTHEDLAALAGKGGKVGARQGKTPLSEQDTLAGNPSCEVGRHGTTIAAIGVEARDEKFQRVKTEAESTGWEPIRPAPLDFGPGAQGWLFRHGTVQLLLRCDHPEKDGRPAVFPFRMIEVSGDRASAGTPVAKIHQIRIDAALRTARELVRAQGCTNAPQLAAQAPAAPF